jgi:hypothetical protein
VNNPFPPGQSVDSSDFHSLMKIFHSALPDSHETAILGKIGGEAVTLARPKQFDPKKKSILIVGGFHGNEVGGPWGICKFLVSKAEIPSQLNVSFIPVVNPSAMMRSTRYNEWGEEPNEGFFEDNLPLSKEGQVLVNNLPELLKLSKNGFVTLHENAEQGKYFFYLLQEKMDATLHHIILQTAHPYFNILPNGEYTYSDGQQDEVLNGCVFNQWDGTFEHYLYTKGSDFCITSETPMDDAPLKIRINANASIIASVLKYLVHKEGF